MIDIHTHILPGMDDGAKDVEMSLAMLRMQREQGVDSVVLTPHFYRNKEHPAHFLRRRQEAFERLQQAMEAAGEKFPQLTLGAEVAWMPNMTEWDEIEQLCLGESKYLLLELPFYTWRSQVIQQIYDLMLDHNITPVFAHLERYLKNQKREYIQEILDMGTPIQVSSAPMAHFLERRPILKMLKNGQAHIMASDCHNITTRPPNLAMGISVVERKLGAAQAERLKRNGEELKIFGHTSYEI